MKDQDYETVSPTHFVIDVELDESILNNATPSASSERSETGGSEGAPSSEVSHNHSQERQKESKIAKTIAKTMRNLLAYDEVQGEWYRYKDNIWQEVTDKTARRIINKKLSESYKNGFSLSFLRNMEGFMQMFLYADDWQTDKMLLPMKNGVLNLDNKIIQSHSFKHRFKWCLPFEYQSTAKCPTIIEWLKTSTHDDEETIQIIRCCFYLALIGSKQVQKFLELLGAGGTGKSTLIRLLIMLLSEQNHVATDLKNLEGNRFEVAIL